MTTNPTLQADAESMVMSEAKEIAEKLITHKIAMPRKDFTPHEYRAWDNTKQVLLNEFWNILVRGLNDPPNLTGIIDGGRKGALQSAFNAGCEAMREDAAKILDASLSKDDWGVIAQLRQQYADAIRNLPTPPYGEKK